MPLDVLFHFDATPRVRAWIDANAGADIRVSCCAESDEAAFAQRLPGAQVIWHVLKRITPAIIDAAPRLRLIQKIGVGVNTIDLDAARARGIAVCNLPGTNTQAVAEMTLALMLACLRRIPDLDRAIRTPGGWALAPEMQDRLSEVGGKTVGLVGFGAVPQRLAPWLAAMGARVLYAARSARPEAPFEHLPLERVLAESDIVSLHVPLTPATDRMIDARALARMKRGAILVNTARGALIDERALADALARGHVAAAGLDVWTDEPAPSDHPLLASPNVVACPHVAWLTLETFERSLALALENCRRVAADAPLLHRVA